MNKNVLRISAVLMLSAPFASSQAATLDVDCGKRGSINAALAKLDRSVANTINITGNCTENVLISSHRDLSLVAVGSASLSAATTNATTVRVNGSSRVAVNGLTINGGSVGFECDDRSVCVLRSVNIVGGSSAGLALQKQSSVDVIDGSIINSGGTGVGVYGASSINIRSEVSPSSPGVVISGHLDASVNKGGTGIFAQDGSFVRIDGGTISGNDAGVVGDRGAVLKLLGTTITGNTFAGVRVRASTAQVSGNVTSNGGHGIQVQRLGYLVFAGTTNLTNNGGQSLQCDHVTAVANANLTPIPNFLTVSYNPEVLEPPTPATPKVTCPATNL